jgi:hypothetical protein
MNMIYDQINCQYRVFKFDIRDKQFLYQEESDHKSGLLELVCKRSCGSAWRSIRQTHIPLYALDP